MNFSFYLNQGINHILDLNGYDHMLFVVALCALYELKNWKRVFILLTAFTVGHSITLLLSGLNYLRLPQDLIETLIPVTILLTALNNIFFYQRARSNSAKFNYAMALIFGFIHGAGFSNFFNAMFSSINDSIIMPLLAFNLGIELGQLIIVAVFFVLYYLLQRIVKFGHAGWNVGVSVLAGGVALLMILGVI